MATTATKRTLRKRNPNKIRENGWVSTIVMYAIAILVLFITLYPMYYVLIRSVSAPEHALAGDMLLFPNMNHSINGCDARAMVYGRMIRFFADNM
mgnify:CR=1 FL=1